ncbi:hypothetical protein [Thalassovita sp.]|uniref:hypothetical protein n=1 Tax=Thalassovita sp. TaxID=1979401 RepID=UPI0029DE583C|nr:hypothetical protein [Thalassovita sp.]
MRSALIALLLCLAPGLAFAQEIVLRSGEHDGFTRLAARLPAGTGWQVDQSGRTLRVVFDPMPRAVDVAQVFDRIGRTRVASVTATENALEIGLACACAVSTSASTSAMLVVDIRMAATAPAAAAAPQTPPGLKYLSGQGLNLSTGHPPAAPMAPPRDFLAERPFPQPNNDRQIKQAEAALLKQLGRAMSSGLVELATPPQAGAPDTVTPPEQSPKRAGDDATHLTAHLGLQTEPGRDPASDTTCLADQEVDIANWVGGHGFLDGLNALRRDLVGETGRVNHATALATVRHYLHFGFGTEAMALLRSIKQTPETATLLSLARLIEGAADVPVGLAQYRECPGAVSLWALLDSAGPTPPGPSDPGHALRAFAELPPHLRDALGPDLSRSLLTAGHDEAAQMVLRILQRQEPPPQAEALYAKAQLAATAGDTQETTALLSQAATSDAPISPLALAELIAGELAAGNPIQPETTDLLASYAHQYRNEGIAARLEHLLVRAHTRAGQFGAAWPLVQPPQKHPERARDFLADLVALGSDFDMLRYGAALRDLPMPPQILTDAADRLLNMGFPDLAAGFEPVTRPRAPTADQSLSGMDTVKAGQAATVHGDPPVQGTSLSAAQSVVSRSRETRSKIAQLLSETAMTE